MLRLKSLLIDTNVWIDYFLGANPGAGEAMRLFETCESKAITLTYAPTSLKDVFYLVPRRMRREAVNQGIDIEGISFSPAAWACVRKMTEIAAPAPLALPECDLAWMLRNTHDDFEDDLVMAAAETSGADHVVTQDQELLERFAPACITPAQALSLLDALGA